MVPTPGPRRLACLEPIDQSKATGHALTLTSISQEYLIIIQDNPKTALPGVYLVKSFLKFDGVQCETK